MSKKFDWKMMDKIVQDSKEKNRAFTDTKCLSNWTPGNQYAKQLQLIVRDDHYANQHHEYVHYPEMFIDNKSLKSALLKKLTAGHSCDQTQLENLDAVFCRNNTTSILDIMLYLSSIGIKKLCITVPRYFSAEVFANKLNIQHQLVDLIGEPLKIPVEMILNEGYDAVWFTSYYSSFYEEQICDIKKLISAGVICIFDECNLPYSDCLVNRLGVDDNLMFICSPHKAISMNGELKFSCILTSEKRAKEMQNEVFSVYGTQTNVNDIPGIHHFLSVNYDNCKKLFERKRQQSLKVVNDVVQCKPNAFKCVKATSTYYVVIETAFIVDDLEHSIEKMVNECNHFVYPMEILDKTQHETLSFRINLLHDKQNIEEGLNEVISFLEKE